MPHRLIVLALASILVLAPAAAAGGTPAAPSVPAVRPSTWARWMVDHANITGEASVLLLLNDQPYIAYYHYLPAPETVRYAYRVAAGTGNCGVALSFQCDTIDSGTWAGFYMDFRMSPSAVPSISYSFGPDYLRYAQYVGVGGNCGPGGGTWRCEEVDGPTLGTQASVGNFNALALDPATGNARISYFDQTHGALLYAAKGVSGGLRCGPAANWRCDTIETGAGAGQTGWDTSLAVKTDGSGVIAYYCIDAGGCDKDLRVARQVGSGGNCGMFNDWQCDTIDAAGVTGWESSLVLDNLGKARVSYFYQDTSTSGNLKYAAEVGTGGNCGPGNTWQCDTIDVGAGVAQIGMYSTLTLDAAGTPHILYYDRTNGLVKFAYRAGTGGNCGPGGNTWRCEVLADAGVSGVSNSGLAVDSDGFVHATYFDAHTADLKYALMRWVVPLPLSLRNY